MLLIQAFFVLGGCALLLTTASLAWRDTRGGGYGRLPGRLLALTALCAGLGLLVDLPDPLRLPPAAENVAWLLAIPSGALSWWFLQSIFDDDYRLDRWQWLGLIVLSLFPSLYWLRAQGIPLAWLGHTDIGLIPPLAMVAHLLWLALSGLRDDLVARRRRARVVVALALALALCLSLTAEQLSDRALAGTVRSGGFFFATIVILFWALRFRETALAFAETEPAPSSDPQTPPTAPSDPRDRLHLQRLDTVMRIECAYLDPELTIGGLAARVGIPEHQLRLLINRVLGQRNFSHYLAQARLAHAKAALADPDKARRPVLSIAMDAGFASLATFNRVFRAQEGRTPTEFRREALEQALDRNEA